MPSLIASFCTAVLLAAGPAAETSRIPKIAFEKYTLPNGLDVILHEDHSAPIVGVNIWYHVGSKNERPGRTGFAHLFEHMMFQGSQHYDKVYFGPLQKVGGRLNGSTANDRTNYWETVPSNYLEVVLWMESDRMGFLLPAMTQKKLDNQRDVVKNERRQSYENRPYGLVHETIQAAMYPPDHPYSWPPIGSMKDIDAASREDIADFFRHYYHPGNASLCIAGDFEPKEAKRLVEKYFAPLPSGPKVVRPKPAVPKLTGETRIHMTDRVGLARLFITWHSPPQFFPGDVELDVLGHILAGGKTSRLYRRLVRDMQIAQDVQAGQDSMEIGSQFMMVLTASPGHALGELEKVAMEEIHRIQTEPPTVEEVAQAVTDFESQVIRSLEPISEFHGRADQLNQYNTLTGDPGYLSKDFQRYAAVTPRGITGAARQYLGAGRVALEVTPGKELTITPDPRVEAAATREKMAKEQGREAPLPAAPAGAESRDRTTMPEAAAEPQLRLPTIRHGKLSNGMKLMLVEKHELPLLHLNLVFPVGESQDPANCPGLAAMMAAVWDEGTARRTSEQIAADLAAIGANLSLGAGADTTSARMFTLKRQLSKALDIYADVLRNPAFPKDELDRQRAMALARLPQIRNEPNALSGIATHELLYGADHPYGRPHFGTASALRAIEPAALVQFYREFIRPEQATLIVVGDITLDEATDVFERALGSWKQETPAPQPPKFPAPPAPKPTSIVLIDKPGAAQSVVSIALMGAERKSPDFFPATVMNGIFGGQFSSRLNMNLREQKGYTYGARSQFVWQVRQPGPFTATASVQTAVTAPSLVEFLKEIDGMLGTRPVAPRELDLCQKYITRGFPAGFETPSQLVGQLETLVNFDLPDDYLGTVMPKINAVMADDVLRVAKQYLKPDQLVIVVVGDREKIEAGLRQLPIGKNLTVYQLDDDFRLKPVKP